MTDVRTPPVIDDSDLETSAAIVFESIFPNTENELAQLLMQLCTEKSENGDTAFGLAKALCKSKPITGEALLRSMDRFLEAPKKIALARSWMKGNPKDEECIVFMDGVVDKLPELVVDLIRHKESWPKAEIRKHLMKYMYRKKLWIELAKIEEELKRRK